ncbi:AGAP012000-PA-like protein [Anopheles sinensis]|uniref:AGAP012000-PA-like protein n=1 Tax=Anopheles sinensis TaxID=74873 RepID=A0A084WK27_ANOSI|nr:AGAP012000-PA-like protein [Anopheles sinensis]
MRSKWFLAVVILSAVLKDTIRPVTGDGDHSGIETLIQNTMREFNHEMLDTLHHHLEDHHHHHHEEQLNACDGEFRKLQNISNMEHEKVIGKLTSYGSAVEGMIDFMKNFEQRTESIAKNLTEANRLLQVSQLDLQKQLRTMQGALNQTQLNVIHASCASVNVKETNPYYIRPFGYKGNPFLALCDFDNHFNQGGGWTHFQRRIDGSVDFYRNWDSYKNGFGDVNGEHWLGLEKLHYMTRWGRHELLVVMEDFKGNSTYALYDDFKIGSEAEKYKLTVGKFSGTSSDALVGHNGMKFSTKDQDNDLGDGKCADEFKGAWWFKSCYNSHLNGQYVHNATLHKKQLIEWIDYPSAEYVPLKATKMMLRVRASNK